MKWRRYEIGRYKLSLFERRARYTGIGLKQCADHNIIEISTVFYIDGVEKWKRLHTYEVTFEEEVMAV